MDARRAIILLGIAVVSYMMVLQWNEDYGQRPVNQAEPVTRLTPAPSNGLSDVPTSIDAPVQNTDAPVVATDDEIPSSDTGIVTDLVSVKTDVLDIRIDPMGGDIVYAALTAFPLSLDNKDIPFVLLEKQYHVHFSILIEY